MGRPVIYYDPHNEKMNYDFEPDNKNLFVVHDQTGLEQALNQVSIENYGATIDYNFQSYYLLNHLGVGGSLSPSDRIFDILKGSYSSNGQHLPINNIINTLRLLKYSLK